MEDDNRNGPQRDGGGRSDAPREVKTDGRETVNRDGELEQGESPRTNLDWALRYAKAGYKIIPCFYNPATGQKPPIHDKNFFNKATDDPKIITGWFNPARGYWTIGKLVVEPQHVLIGLPTGPVNGIDVVDIDKKRDVDGHITVPGWQLLSSVIAATPTGGHHLFHRHDARLRLKNEASEVVYKDRRYKLPGVDIRTQGGYVILPGSTLPDGKGAYSWLTGDVVNSQGEKAILPEVNLEILTLQPRESLGTQGTRKRRKKLETVEPADLYQSRAATWVNKLAAEVAEAVSGTRDETLKDKLFAVGPCVHAGLVTEEYVVAAFWAAIQANGLDQEVNQHQLENKVRDALAKSKDRPLPDHLRERDRLGELNEKHFVIETYGNEPVVGEWLWDDDAKWQTLGHMSFRGFENRYRNEQVRVGEDTVKLGKAWLDHKHRRQYHSIFFNPAGPEVDQLNRLNLYRGYGFKGEAGTWKRMFGHVYRVLAQRDPEVFRYVVRWAAWCVRYPELPAEVALILRGGQGAGKGMFGRFMVKLFGSHGLQVTRSEEITGKFNAHLRYTCLLFADEAVRPRDAAAASILKALLTEEELTFRDMYRLAKRGRNVTKVIMASNDEHVTHVEVDDRRNAVFDVTLDLRGPVPFKDRDGKELWTFNGIMNGRFRERDDYFAWLKAELKDENHAAALHDLIGMDLGAWHPRKNIPNTEAREEQKELTRNPYVELLARYLDLVEEGAVTLVTLYELLGIHFERVTERHRIWVGNAVRRELKGWRRDKSLFGRNVTAYVKGSAADPTRLTVQDLRDLYDIDERATQARQEERRAADVRAANANADLIERMQRDQEEGA